MIRLWSNAAEWNTTSVSYNFIPWRNDLMITGMDHSSRLCITGVKFYFQFVCHNEDFSLQTFKTHLSERKLFWTIEMKNYVKFF